MKHGFEQGTDTMDPSEQKARRARHGEGFLGAKGCDPSVTAASIADELAYCAAPAVCESFLMMEQRKTNEKRCVTSRASAPNNHRIFCWEVGRTLGSLGIVRKCGSQASLPEPCCTLLRCTTVQSFLACEQSDIVCVMPSNR